MSENKRGVDLDPADVVSVRAEEQLTCWAEPDRALFSVLWEDAKTETKKELLRRVLAQGHSPDEVSAFAQGLLALGDEEACQACTLSKTHALYESVQSRLWAEADPIYAWVLNGHPLQVRSGSKNPLANSDAGSELAGRKKKPRLAIVAASACQIGEDLFNEVAKPFGFSFSERSVDQDEQTLEEALALAIEALGQDLCVPVLLGEQVGQYQCYALLLDAEKLATDIVFSLYEMKQDKLISLKWSDVRSGNPWLELTQGRMRITALALPSTLT